MIRKAAFPALLFCVACEGVLGGGASDSEANGSGTGSPGDSTLPDGTPGSNGPGASASTTLSLTPVARLTNREFVASIADALGIPQDSDELHAAGEGLPVEPKIGGLHNDAAGQLLTHVVLGSYSSVVDRVSEIFLDGVEDEAGLGTRLACEEGALMDACVSGFAERVRRSAYRRPLTDSERDEIQSEWERFDQLILDTDAEGPGIEILKMRVQTYLRATFLGPDFLLQVERGLGSDSNVKPLDSNEIATRLAYFLTGAPPNEALREAASSGDLGDPDVRRAQAERLMKQPSARAHVVSLVTRWLEINERSTPEWTQVLEDFIGEWFDEEKPFSDFYQGSVTVSHLDGTQSEEPLGVLGSHAFLASHTSFPTAAFITRGASVVEDLLCSELPADIPVEAFDSESVTDVEVFTAHAQQPCATCHRIFDNFGAALHQFDGKTGLYVPGPSSLGTGFELPDLGGTEGVVDDAQSLAAVLASSEKAASCVASFWYRSAGRRGIDYQSRDETAIVEMLTTWQGSDAPSLKALFLDIIESESFATFVLPE